MIDYRRVFLVCAPDDTPGDFEKVCRASIIGIRLILHENAWDRIIDRSYRHQPTWFELLVVQSIEQ